MKKLTVLTAALVFAASASAFAAEPKAIEVVIKDHQFSPAEVKVPANEKVTLIIKNQDATPEEFESHDLKREKVIKANSEAKVLVGPLKPGKYEFFGEFNPKTAKGQIIAE